MITNVVKYNVIGHLVMKKIIILGAGIMGSGIAQVIAQANMKVCIIDNNPESIQKSKKNITFSLNRLIQKNILSKKNVENILNNNIVWEENLKNILKNFSPEIIIEAVPEDFQLKKSLISITNDLCCKNSELIYASNTSSISITKMASTFFNPSNFIGMHFMNPVPLMKLVEIIPGLQTSKNTIKIIEDLAKKINKITVTSKDFAGFIANRILIPMINEAFYALMEGLGNAEDIDNAMTLGCNHPMGPLKLADFIGLDTCLYVSTILHKEIGDTKYRPCPLLKKYVSAGWLGKKSKRGVYQYEK